MLKIKLKGRDHDAVWVVEKHYGIGRDSSNHLVIDDDSISPSHARLITRDNALYLKDNNSRAGSYVNDRRITQKKISPGDLIRLGRIEIEVLPPHPESAPPNPEAPPTGKAPLAWTLVSDSSWLAGQEFKILNSPAVIGRSSSCDITIPGTHLSRQHVEITIKRNRLHIRDLASANGTYINDARITQGVARAGDRLRLDVYSFRIIGPGPEARENLPSIPPDSRRRDTAAPKQWKVRPTSPGNRIVEPESNTGTHLLAWVSVGLCLVMIAALAYVFGVV